MTESSVNVKKVYIGFGAILVITLLLIMVAYNSISQIERASLWIVYDYDVIVETRHTAKSLSDMEMSARGYLLTGRPEQRATWDKSKKSFSQRKGNLEGLARDNPEQLKLVQQLSPQMKAWMDLYNPIIRARDDEGAGRALEMSLANRTVREEKRLALQRTLAAIEKVQLDKLDKDKGYLGTLQLLTKSTLVVDGLLAIVMGTVLALYLTRSSRVLLKANQGLMKEIAERKRTQREIHDLHAQNEQILSSTAEGIIGLNQRSRVTFANAAAASMLRTELEQLISKSLDTVLRKEPRPNQLGGLSQFITASMRDGKTYQVNDEVFLRRDNSSFPVEYTVTPLKEERVDDENHEVTITGALIVFRDITERRKAQQMLLRLASIVESSKDAILSHTLDGRIVSWNAAALALYDFMGRDLENKNLSLLFPATATDEVEMLLQKIRDGERVEPYQTTLVQRDGSLINVALTLYPVRDANGQVMGASSNARLVVRRQAEDHLPTFPAALTNNGSSQAVTSTV